MDLEVSNLYIEFDIVEVNTNYNTLYWHIQEQFHKDVIFKGFNVLFSYTENDGFKKVNSSTIDSNKFTHNIKNFNKLRRGYYKIEAISNNDKIYHSETYGLYPHIDEFSNLILRREMFGLMTTTPLALLKVLFYFKRYSGEKCSKCKTIGRSAQGNCPICLGTGWSGGYFKPNLGFIKFDSMVAEQTNIDENGVSNYVGTQIRTSAAFGVLRPKDLIKEIQAPNRLWIVENVQKTEANNRPISLIMNVKQAETGHPLSAIPAPRIKLPPKIYYETFREVYYNAQSELDKINS